MSTGKSGRTEKMVNSLLDTGADSVTQWGNEFISTNAPRILDSTVTKIKEIFSSVSTSSNMKSREFIRSIIFQGIEIGESNMETALVQAMRETGLDESQIHQILETSKKHLVTKEDVESSMK